MKTKRMIMMSMCMVCCLGWALNAMAASYDPIVEKVQVRLAELGYDVGTADGKMGPKTIEVIKKFQQDQGLTVTGQIDEATIQQLDVRLLIELHVPLDIQASIEKAAPHDQYAFYASQMSYPKRSEDLRGWTLLVCGCEEIMAFSGEMADLDIEVMMSSLKTTQTFLFKSSKNYYLAKNATSPTPETPVMEEKETTITVEGRQRSLPREGFGFGKETTTETLITKCVHEMLASNQTVLLLRRDVPFDKRDGMVEIVFAAPQKEETGKPKAHEDSQIEWVAVDVNGDPDCEFHLEYAEQKLSWSPAKKGLIGFFVTKVQGSEVRNGKIMISGVGTIIAKDGVKTPLLLEDFKQQLELTPGWYAAQIRCFSTGGNWIVFEVN